MTCPSPSLADDDAPEFSLPPSVVKREKCRNHNIVYPFPPSRKTTTVPVSEAEIRDQSIPSDTKSNSEGNQEEAEEAATKYKGL
ncbi:hypothetical protein GJ744_008471 [Endocarpon pusillum]|uniref:Uncharacterized protein n=1 Tax=Endocarpon pusillum TaxID=364733 RepID=A0A8H7AL98_9EURO|nr:hypothetical protein GJ744_008471 [Endocarpon pusillum]